MDKKQIRLRRAKRFRMKVKELEQVRLCVHRTPRHTYAQIISGDGSTVLAAASTLEKDIRSACDYTGNVNASVVVGEHIAKRALEKGITEVAFDRSGFKYHGRVKALADSARKHGLKF